MPLITCPECGKSVSDTADTCIHCGAPLRCTAEVVQPEAEKEQYYKLSFSRQAELKDEFNNQFPKYAQVKDRNNLFLALIIVCYIVVVILLFHFFYKFLITKNLSDYWFSISDYWFSITWLSIALCCDIIAIVLNVLKKRNKKKNLIVLKKYQTWLLHSKNIEYKVYFTGKESKWQKIYDSINDTEDI